MRSPGTYVLLTLLVLAACEPGPAGRLGGADQAIRQENGVSLNGISLNGVSLNGVSLNGVSLNGVSLNGVSLNGVSLNGSELVGVDGSGATLSGNQLDGAQFDGLLSDGSTFGLKIGTSWLETKDPDIRWYQVLYWGEVRRNKYDWIFLANAVPLAGRWDMTEGTPSGGSRIDDPGVFTFAGSGGALTKCLLLGYKPWQSYGGTSLRDYHQACTRAIRADYCGNGQPWTVDGRLINIYDKLNLQVTDGMSYKFEAEWRPDGARCVSNTRADEMWAAGQEPSCVPAIVQMSCGSPTPWSYDSAVLLATETTDTTASGGGKGGGKK